MDRLLRAWELKREVRFHGRSPGSRFGYKEVGALAWASLLGRAN
jgi:hypothetical protein